MEESDKETCKIEKARNRKKLLNQKKNQLKRKAETQRKVHMGSRESSTIYNSKWIYPFEFLSGEIGFPQELKSTVVKRCIFAPFEKGSEDTYHHKDTKI